MKRWLERAFGIRPGEFALVQAFFLFFVGIGMYYTVGATVGDTLFLSSLPQEEIPNVLPWIYIGIAVVGFLVTLLYDYVQRRYSRLAVIVGTQLGLAASVLLFRAVIHLNWPSLYYALSVWMEVSALLSITLFFSFAGDYFTSRDARRLYGFIVGGMALGTVVGGHGLSVAVLFLGTRNLLYLGVCFLLLNALICWRIYRFATPAPVEAESYDPSTEKVSMKAIFARPYVRLLGAMILIAMVTSVVVDYQMKWIASSLDEDTLAQFFGTFYGRIGIAQLLFQFLLVPRLLRSLGIINCLLILPVLIGLASSVVYAGSPAGYVGFSMLSLAAVVNFIRITVNETLDLPSREMLFLPLPTRVRVRAQPFINGALTAAARVLSGLFLLLLYSMSVGVENLSIVAIGGCVLLIMALLGLRPKYRETLAATLHTDQMDTAGLGDVVHSPSMNAVVGDLLHSSDPSVVKLTLGLMQNRQLEELKPALEELLASRDSSIAVEALHCLGSDPSADFLPHIRRAMESQSFEVRQAAVLAFCQMRGVDAFDEMSTLLDSPDPAMQNAAIVGLAQHCGTPGKKRVLSLIEGYVKSPKIDNRIRAAQLLGGIGQAGYTALVRKLLADADPSVRAEALDAVGHIGDSALVPDMLGAMMDVDLKPFAIRALAAMPQSAAGPLIERIRDRFWPISDRRILMGIIAQIGGPEAAEVLWENITREDQDLGFRCIAAQSLRALKIREGIPNLRLRGYRGLIRQLKQSITLLNAARAEVGGVDEFAAEVYKDNARISMELMLSLFALKYQPRQLDRILLNLFAEAAPVRARAVELLDEVLPWRIAPGITALAQPLIEVKPGDGRGLSPHTRDQLLRSGPWLRAVTAYHLSKGNLDPDRIKDIELTPWEKELFRRLDLVVFFKAVPLFKDLAANYLLEQTEITGSISMKKGAILFGQGSKAEALYIVAGGEVQMLVGGGEVARFTTGESVGEMALIDDQPHEGSAVMATDGRLFLIKAEKFKQLLTDQPVIAKSMLRILDRRIRKLQEGPDTRDSSASIPPMTMHIAPMATTRDLQQIIPNISFLRQVDLFSELPMRSLTRLAAILEEVRAYRGQVLFEQDAAGDSLYLICSGEVEVVINGKTVSALGPNACLGETALIASLKRTATARVSEDAKLLRLRTEDFHQMLVREPDMAKALLRTLSLRLRQLLMWR